MCWIGLGGEGLYKIVCVWGGGGSVDQQKLVRFAC